MRVFTTLLGLSALLASVACQSTRDATKQSTNRNSASRTRSRTNLEQARTLGLLSPLLGFGLRSPIRIGSTAQSAAAGVASDPIYGGGNNYGYYPSLFNGIYSNPGYGGYPNLGGGLGYRPLNYGNNYANVGYQNPNLYPAYNGGASSGYYPTNNLYNGLGNLGGLGSTYQRPSNYYPGYQQPYYGGAGNLGLLSNAVSSNPAAVSAASGVGGSAASSSQQQAQIAALLGQALGSSLRPLLAGGGGLGASASPAAIGGGSSAGAGSLGGLLSLLG